MYQELLSKIKEQENTILSLHEERKTWEEDKSIIQTQLELKNKELVAKQAEIIYLNANLDLLKILLFKRKSEKFDPKEEQYAWLFNEAEVYENEKEINPQVEEVKAHVRKKAGRKKIPAHFPRHCVFIEIPVEELGCGCGDRLQKIGEVVSEQYELIPASVLVIKTIRYKYACKKCEGSGDEAKPAVRVAPKPPEFLPKTMITTATLAHFIVQKFCDHIPYYRLVKILERYEIDLSRATLSNYTIKAFEKIKPILEVLLRKIFACSAIQVDETDFIVMKEPGRENTTKSHMMAMIGFGNGENYYYYRYEESRSASFLLPYLKNFQGVIQTDGLSSYDTHLNDKEGIVHAGCNVHARRPFANFLKTGAKSDIAKFVIDQYAKIYKLEDEFKERNLDITNIQKEREAKSLPIMLSIKEYLEKANLSLTPKSPIGGAVKYFLRQWPKLIQFIYHGRIPPDTNLVENIIRPFALGRKNWMISGSPHGAHASAGFYTLVQNAKLCGLDPYDYLRRVFLILEKDPETNPESLIPQAFTRGGG